MRNLIRLIGFLSIALALCASFAHAGELSNVTVGRFEDFTVVTLFGEGPLSVTHQIVEAKDGKPHRIVVDVTGAVHRLPQNNFTELPEGSIKAIRTSQFAVSPEPVVRVVIDLAHPATYRLESPEGQVRLLISLPGDPVIASTWSARGGSLPATAADESVTLAATPSNDAATPSTTEPMVTANATPDAATNQGTVFAENESTPKGSTAAAAAPAMQASPEGGAPNTGNTDAVDAHSSDASQAAPAQAEPAKTEPVASPIKDNEAKSLPPASTGAMAATAAATSDEPSNGTAPEVQATESATANDQTPSNSHAELAVLPVATESNSTASKSAATKADEATAPSNSTSTEDAVLNVPMPEASKNQSERTIDYNLPAPAAAVAVVNEGADQAQPEAESMATPTATEEPAAPKMAATASEESTATEAPAQAQEQVSSDINSGATDEGSAPMASLTTLPPLSESAQNLVPDRAQAIYHTAGRRDPFKPLLASGGYSASNLPDVSTLKLVGVLMDVEDSWGLFEDANGNGFILRKGDRVRNGTLTQLTTNRAYFSLTEFGWSRSVHIDLEPEG